MSQLIQLFSFDVVGSAAFKVNQANDDDQPEWLEAFRRFYEEIPLIFTAQIANAFFDLPGEFPNVPVWKAIGDELVFIAYPEDLEAVRLLTEAFATAMWQANQRFQSDWNLGVHGATWSFEEGHRNIAVRFRELENDATPVTDLIGPDVDLGFRLVSHAAAGRILVPLSHQQRLEGSRLTVEQIGQAHLKGIRFSPYPLLQVSLAREC